MYLTDLASTLTELKALAEKCVAEASRPGFEAEIEALDVTKEEEIDSVVANAAKRFGRIDYAVNVAGVCAFFLLSIFIFGDVLFLLSIFPSLKLAHLCHLFLFPLYTKS